VDKDNCTLYELFNAFYTNSNPTGSNSWTCYSSAYFDLKVKGFTRPTGWTSADAAGLPIFPGLIRYDEVAAGSIEHAVRVTLFHCQVSLTKLFFNVITLSLDSLYGTKGSTSVLLPS